MNRRAFISGSVLVSSGWIIAGDSLISLSITGCSSDRQAGQEQIGQNLYTLFREPKLSYHPYVRWWWNGNKVEAGELIRELRLLKAAGIGGVEINPVEFPTHFPGDDLGKPSLDWLSDEWIDMLKVVFAEADRLGMTCDLIVGSGWPFGSQNLEVEEQAQVVVIGVRKIPGPLKYEITKDELLKEADPAISSPWEGRSMELMGLTLVPDPIENLEQVTDLNNLAGDEVISFNVPDGAYALYALVKITGFMQVINGAPGASGPVLNHYDEVAVSRYLNRMSDAIEKRIGPLNGKIRALFTDSLELEGSNWTQGIADEFQNRRGYDLLPFLPYILFKTGSMGNMTDRKYGVNMSPQFENMINRVRYDYEITKAELLDERFLKTFTDWCRKLNVKSRAQAYGRGLFPLESSFRYDIPECESWTMNWLKHRVGEEMPESDHRRGRAYTMINKYVSSAANLTGKRLVSCEEMTNTYTVFNTSLENLKVGGDQSAITGVTHSIFHGFNYSPPEAPYPGWLRYGGYYNENNTWWPWFNLFNEYKARLSALLQNVTMFTDIAILPPQEDMWSLIGSQMEPFPSMTHVDYMTLVWEAVNKNGHGCDYVSERVIRDSDISEGYIAYGPKKYHTLILVQVDTLDVTTATILLGLLNAGGRIICIESVPGKSPGWKNHQERDKEVKEIVSRMAAFKDKFLVVPRPDSDFIGWFGELQKRFNLEPYIRIEKPDPFLFQTRYVADDGSQVVFLVNSHLHKSHKTRVIFSESICGNRHRWIWIPENGNRYRIDLDGSNGIALDIGPAESLVLVFDRNRRGDHWRPLPVEGEEIMALKNGWSAEFVHCHNGTVKILEINTLTDIKEVPEFVHFAGEIIYRNSVDTGSGSARRIILNLGKVYGLSELKVNGVSCGVKWYGRRIYDISEHLKHGINNIEIRVVTSMGNYMKSLTDNPIAQYWTNERNKIQPLQSMGLVGPVTLYQ